MFVTVLTTAHHSILSQMNPVHIFLSYFPNTILIYSHLRLLFPIGHFPSGILTKILYGAEENNAWSYTSTPLLPSLCGASLSRA